MRRLKDDPFIKIVYRRTFKVHYKTLFACVKDRELLKLYTLYLNLHSLYKVKVFKDYKTRYHELKRETGFSIGQLKKYIPKLLEYGIIFSKEGKHLHIGSHKRWFDFLGIEYTVGKAKLTGERFQYWHSKTSSIKRRKTLSLHELESFSLELLRKQKRWGFVLRQFSSRREVTQNIRKSGLANTQTTLTNKCATDLTSDRYLHLCLVDIQRMFGLNSKQAASQRLSQLESKSLLNTTPVFRYLGKIGAVTPTKYSFIKGEWYIEQLPNHIKFNSPFTKDQWWDSAIDRHFEQVENTKRENRKLRGKDNTISLKLKRLLNAPLKYTKKQFKDTYVDITTGEIAYECIYYIFKDLTVRGGNFFKEYVTKYKKLDLKQYQKFHVQIGGLGAVEKA